MAENKQYITQIQEGGNVMISEDVVATIVEHTLTEVEDLLGGLFLGEVIDHRDHRYGNDGCCLRA